MKSNTIILASALLALAVSSRASGPEAAKAVSGVSFAEWDAGGPRRSGAPAVQAGPATAKEALVSASGEASQQAHKAWLRANEAATRASVDSYTRLPDPGPPPPTRPGLASRQASDARRQEAIAAARFGGPPFGASGAVLGAVMGAKGGAVLCSPGGPVGIVACGGVGLVAGAAVGTVVGYGVGAGLGYSFAWAATTMGQAFEAFDQMLASRSERIANP